MAPIIHPMAKTATSKPASVFESANSLSKYGSKGVRSEKNRASPTAITSKIATSLPVPTVGCSITDVCQAGSPRDTSAMAEISPTWLTAISLPRGIKTARSSPGVCSRPLSGSVVNQKGCVHQQ